MAVQMIDLKCSGCGFTLTPADVECPRCGNAITVTSFNSVYAQNLPTLNKLSRALDKDLRVGASPELDGNIKFTLGGCYLKLKLYDKALLRFEEAIEENFDNPEASFYAARKHLRISPDWKEELELAQATTNLSPTDCDMLFDILAVERPAELTVF